VTDEYYDIPITLKMVISVKAKIVKRLVINFTI